MQGDDGKPRPALVIESDLFNETHAKVTVAPMTSTIVATPLLHTHVLNRGPSGVSSPADRVLDP